MPPTIKHTLNFDRMRIIFFFALILILTIGILYILKPFFYPIFWAAIIAVMFSPMHDWLFKKLRHPAITSFVMLVIILLILIIPLAILSTLVVNQSFDLYQTISSRDLASDIEEIGKWVDGSILSPFVEQAKSNWPKYISTISEKTTRTIFTWAANITQNSAKFMFMFFILLYTLYYFFKDGKRILEKLMYFSPLGNKYEQMMFDKFNSVTRATMKSTFLIGGIQGFLGGILFWVTGIEGALIWGLIMTILSIIPAVGSVIVWLPAGIIMLALGNVWQGVIILILGTFVISLLDNLLRPPLIGKDVEMHPLLVLFSTLGGLMVFGISGFVIGPIIASLYLAIMSIYNHYYKHELSHN